MEELREQLIQLLIEAQKKMPPEAAYYVFKDVFRDWDAEYKIYAANQKKAKEEAAIKAASENKEEEEKEN